MRLLRHLMRSVNQRRPVPPRVVALLTVMVVTGLSLGCQQASARQWRLPRGVRSAHLLTGGRLSDPQATCDVPEPQDQYITFPSFAQTHQEICGIWSIEDSAEAAYDTLHGYPSGDPRAVDTGLAQEAGYAESFLEDLAYEKSTGATGFTADQEGALAWFEAIEQQFQITVAQDALNEYDKWAKQRCSYLPPSTQVFSYRPRDQAACDKNPSLEDLYSGLTPPSEADFISYGTYKADQAFDIGGAVGGSSDQLLIDQGITEGAGAIATVIGGAAPQLLAQVQGLQGPLAELMKAIHPKDPDLTLRTKLISQWQAQNAEAVDAAQEVNRLKAAGYSEEEIDPDLLETAATAEEEMSADAGITDLTAEAAEGAADDMSAEFAVATIAITIAVSEGEAVFTAADIPSQLQANLSQAEHPSNINSYAWNEVSGNSGAAVTTLANVDGQMQFPQTTIGNAKSLSCPNCLIYDNPPATAKIAPAQLRMTALNAHGDAAGWSETAATASNIDTWPMGASDGNAGVPEVNVAIDNGEVWTSEMAGSAPTDQSEAGLSGYLPSGELHYFNAAGKPMIAYLDGNQFATLTNPGSNDAGGADAGDACATAGECTFSNSIVVMAYGGTPQLQDTLTPGTYFGAYCSLFISDQRSCYSDNLLPDGDLVPAGGSASATNTGTIQQQGTSQLYRLTIDPDNGTPAATWVANKYNTTANDLGGGEPNGGLIAGQSVTFTDPEISPQGYSTNYTWQIQALCAYDQGHAPETIQGVPVCSNSPDYGSLNGLATNEQDLTSCSDNVAGTTCNPTAVFGWSEDPAFHGGAVTTLTGQSVNWTWPAPGTYHVRLITTDQNGVSVTSNQDLVVSASSAPSSTLSWSAASGKQPAAVAPSVIGPVTDGDAVTLTGCVSSSDTVAGSAYSTPSVKVDWGDGGTPDSGTAGGSSDANLVFTFAPGGGCSTPWEYQATHTYAVSTSGQPFIQVPITVTVGDVTDPVTPATLVPAGTNTSSTVKVYANVYASSAAPSFVSGASTYYDFQAGDPQTVTGYVTSATSTSVTGAPAVGVSRSGVSCTPGLPSGVGFTAPGGESYTIDGTPNVSAGGCYAIDVTAVNGYGTTTQQVIIDVAQTPAFTSGASVGWTTGTADSFTVKTSGFPTSSLNVTNVTCNPGCGSSLPSDISFTDNGDGTATLSSGGADIAAGDTGVYDITLTASSSSGTVTQTLELTIAGPPIFTSPNTAGFPVQQDKTFDINVTGLSGQPAGSITCTIVYDGSPAPCLSDSGYPRIDPSPNGVYGLYFIDGGNGTATIGGAAYAAGSYILTLTATNAAGDSVQQTLSIYVSSTGGAQLTMPTPLTGPDNGNLVSYTAPSGQAPAFGTARFIVGQSGSVTLCSDDPSDRLTSQSQLPAGLTLTNGVAGTACPSGDEATTISGTPSADVNPNSTGYAADRIVSSANGLADLTIYLINAGNNGNYSSGTPSITSPSTAVFTEGAPGSFTTSIGTVYYGNYQILYGCLSESGALPDGLSFADHADNTGILSGTPTQSGTFTVTVTGSDCGTDSTTQQLKIIVRDPPAFTSAGSAGFQVGAGGTFTVTTNADAYPTPTLSAGALPAGVTFTDNGDGTGTLTVAPDAPKASTAVPIAITASSVAGTAAQQFDLAVGVGPQISSPATSPTPVVMATGSAASYTVTTSGVPTPALSCEIAGTACSTANLPAGVTFTDNGDGTATVSGTPTTLGTADLTITASNGVGTPASTTLDVAVEAAPHFAGSVTSGSCASASPTTTADTFVADSASSWTLCGSGSPAPAVTLKSVTCASASTNLPSGVTFSDNGDGSATLSGTAAIGTGAACRGGYSLDVEFTNAAGSVDKQLVLKVQEVIVATTPPTTAAIVAGAPNQIVLGAAGSPSPAFAPDPSTPLPSWLKLNSLGNGTATLTGKPPASAAGESIPFSVDISNADANTLVESITVPVSKILLEKAAPPAARIGHAYSYRFKASPRTTFSVAPGSKLPLGLKLSRAGLLSGTPRELGRFAVALQLSGAGQTAATGMVELAVDAGRHPLEIGQFRTIGPHGQGDWFVQIVNTTPVTIPLSGWKLGLQQVGSMKPALIPLGSGKLAPGRTVVVSGTGFSRRTKLSVHHFGATAVPVMSGFEIVAPSGVAVDAAGLRGAARSLRAGAGLHYPRHLQRHKQYAFVRDGFAAGHPVDSGNNARNFEFGDLVLHPHRTLTHHATKKKKKKKKRARDR